MEHSSFPFIVFAAFISIFIIPVNITININENYIDGNIITYKMKRNFNKHALIYFLSYFTARKIQGNSKRKI